MSLTDSAPRVDRGLPSGRRVLAAQVLLVALIVTSLPLAGFAVFVLGSDRNASGDFVSVVFYLALVALLTSPWWPTARSRARTRWERLQATVLIWFGVTFTTHVTWELGWLLFRGAIQAAPDAVWAYPWWAYIDGGDARYAGNDPTLVSLEILSVLNGLIGFTALWLWHRSARRNAVAIHLLMATAVVHLYSTFMYFSTEILDGYPNVDTTSFIDLYVKFLLLNGLWLVVPWLVLLWGHRSVRALPAE
ncbi:emopamil-binding family protein [Nocardioides sp.]|uniref:EXPERA domain-containing protein n=1 Tax=Nocardioides sp. TaxID=35761 RepID=UPI0027350661|nr:emopamil-binding family protein [Nocardioides sp.]MDP3893956.1 emopamil-binding family protein [Nocardioides sp.]